MKRKRSKRVYKPGYDAPREGYRRWTVHINADLLKQFYALAEKEGKTMVEATEEAISNWVDYEPDNDD